MTSTNQNYIDFTCYHMQIVATHVSVNEVAFRNEGKVNIPGANTIED